MVSVDALVTGGKQLFLRHWVGLLVGFAGIVLLVWPDITAGGASGREFAVGVVAAADRVRRLGGRLVLHAPARDAARRAGRRPRSRCSSAGC